MKIDGINLDVRVSTIPCVYGEKCVIRLLSTADEKTRKITDLGMTDYNYEMFKQIIRCPNGVMLVTGPTGSGKSTTLYATLGELSKPNVNIVTVEDPVEKKIEGVNQYQINAKAEQLSTFDHVEAIAFEGLVQMEVDELCQTNGGELPLQRLLDLAYSVDGCHVVPEVRDDAALGRFYVENDFLSELEQVPDSVLELLDYAKIGEKMRRDEHSAMTPNGYVVREAELRQAPPNLGRPPRKPPYMIHFLCVSDVRAVKLYLPAKQAELDAVLDCLEVDSWQEVR